MVSHSEVLILILTLGCKLVQRSWRPRPDGTSIRYPEKTSRLPDWTVHPAWLGELPCALQDPTEGVKLDHCSTARTNPHSSSNPRFRWTVLFRFISAALLMEGALTPQRTHTHWFWFCWAHLASPLSSEYLYRTQKQSEVTRQLNQFIVFTEEPLSWQDSNSKVNSPSFSPNWGEETN